MTQVKLDSSEAVSALEALKRAAGDVRGAFANLDAADPSKFMNQVKGLETSLSGVFSKIIQQFAGLETALVESSKGIADAAAKAGKGVGDGLSKGIKDGGDEAIRTVRLQKQQLQTEYEQYATLQSKAYGSLSNQDLAKYKARGVGLFSEDMERLSGGMRAKSATRMSEDDTRAFLGMPDRGQMKSFAASLKAQMAADMQTGVQRAKSATRMSEDDTRALLGVPDRGQMKSFAASLKAQMSEDMQTGALRAKSATRMSEDDTRAFLGMPDRGQMKSFAASLKAQMAADLSAAAQVRKATDSPSGSFSTLEGELVRVNGAAHGVGGAFRSLRVDTNDLHSAARGLASGFGAMWLTWGNVLPLLAGAALSNGFVQVVRMGSEVDHSLTTLKVLGGESSASVAGLKDQMLDLAKVGPMGPKDITEALKTLTLAGLSAAEVGSSLKDVLNFSVAGEVGIKEAAETLVSISTAFGVSARDFSYVSDIISTAAAESKATVTDMSAAFKTAATVHQEYGVSLEDSAVGLALLANAGIKGTAAGTSLRNMVADLTGRTKKSTEAFRELGVEAIDLATGKVKPLGDVMGSLLDRLQQMTSAKGAMKFLQTIFDERGAKEAYAIFESLQKKASETGESINKSFSDLREKMVNAGGFAAIAAAEMALTPMNQMKSVVSTLQSTMVEAFDSISPYIITLTHQLRSAFASEEFKTGVTDMVTGLGQLAVLLVEHGRAIATVVIGYVALKSVVAVLAEVRLAWMAITAAEAAAGTAAAGAGIAMRAAAAANPILLAITAAVTAGAAAWSIYQLWSSNSSETVKDSLPTQAALLENLLKEEERVKKVNEARALGITLQELEARGQLQALKNGGDTKLLEANSAVQGAAIRLRNAELGGTVTSVNMARSDLTKVTESRDAILETYRIMRKEIDRVTESIKSQTKATADAVRAEQEAKLKGRGALFKGTLDDVTGSGAKGKARGEKLEVAHDNILAMQRKMDEAELSLEQERSNNRMSILKAHASGVQALQGAVMIAELNEMSRHEGEKLKLLEGGYEEAKKTISTKILELTESFEGAYSSNSAAGNAKANADLTNKYSTEVGNLVRELTALGVVLDANKTKTLEATITKQTLLTIGLENEVTKIAKTYSDFWRAQAEAREKAQRQAGLEDQLRYASPEAQAWLQATASAHESLASETSKLQKTMDETTESYLLMVEQAREDGEYTEGEIKLLKAKGRALEEVKKQLDALRGAAPALIEEAGTRASVKYDKDYLADLQKGVSESIVTGLLEGGQKGSSQLRNLIMAELRKPIVLAVQALVNLTMSAMGVGGGGGVAGAAGVANSFSGVGKLADMYLGKGMAGFATSNAGAALGLSTGATRFSPAADAMVANGNTMTTAGELFSAMPIGGMITAYTKGGVGGFVQGAAGIAASGAVSGAMATGTAAGAFTGAGAALAAVPVWGWAAMAALAILGKDKTYVKSTGESSKQFDANGKVTSTADYRYADVDNKGADAMVTNVNKSYIDAAKRLNIKALDTTVGFGGSDSEGGKYRLSLNAGGKSVYDTGEVSTSNSDPNMAAAQAVIAALKASDLPKYLKGLFDDVKPETLDKAGVENLLAEADALKAVHDAFDSLPLNALTDASYATVKAVADASGGLDKLSSNLASYYANFYTDAEKAKMSTASLSKQFKDLGVEMPSTKKAFRTLIDSLDLTKASDQKLAASLYALSPAYAATIADLDSVNATFGSLGGTLFAMDGAGVAAASGLAAAMGGLEAMNAAMSSYIQGYYNDAERKSMTVDTVTKDLNAAGLNFTKDQVAGASRADIRNAVNSLDANKGTEQGAVQYAAAIKAANMLDWAVPKLDAVVKEASGGGGGGGAAAASIGDAWKTIVDSLWGEVKRIKGLIEETGPDAYASAQARFYLTTAAARSGDKDAAAALPGVSQALLALAENNTSTLLELKSMQGSVAGSLTTTATLLSNQYGLSIPSFDVGTDFVPRDMIAMIHEGERITPRAFNPAIGGDSNAGSASADFVTAMRRMEARFAKFEAQAEKTHDLWAKVTENGKAIKTEVFV